MAAAHDLDVSRIAGTGRGGRVTKRDVQAHLDRGPDEPLLHSDSPYRPDPPAAPAAPAPVAPSAAPPAPAAPAPPAPVAADLGGVAEPLSRMRQRIGVAMRRSLDTAATCTTIVECDMSTIERRRRELGLTALPLLARHTIDVLLGEFGDLNATLDGTTMTRYDRVHLGIAVSLGADGLIVPVIHDAQDLSPEGLGKRIRDVAARARSKQLTPDDVRGATFTITNPGAFGALIATPVIDVPQVAILDLEAIVRRPVVVTDDEGRESIAIRPMVNLCLGWDHRAMDGGYAAQFLTALRRRIEAG
jgi:pyruvate/2-oxoglutarate dehydrogenase complex dihydrolipoamide acyltransferase (E2) component